MKTKKILGMTASLLVAQVTLIMAGEAVIKVGRGGTLPSGVTVIYGNEPQMIAAGTATITRVRAVPCPAPTPTPSITQSAQKSTTVSEKNVYAENGVPGASAAASASASTSIIGASASASATVSGGGPAHFPSYLERNDSFYESRHYNTPYYPDQVFWYGAVSYPSRSVVSVGQGYHFVDNYRGFRPPAHSSRQYCAPRQSPRPTPQHSQQGGGYHGGRRGR